MMQSYHYMSKSTDHSKDFFMACRNNIENFFDEIGKSSPVYHQITTDTQQSFLDAWKNVIKSSITIQQEYATKAGLNINMSDELMKTLHSMTEKVTAAYHNQNKFAIDSTETSKKVFDVYSENVEILSLLNKNMMELMDYGMKKSQEN